MSARFPEVDWYCDECDADLGKQSGFDDHNVIFDPWEFLADFDPNKFGRS